MATITGSVSTNPTRYSYYITWTETDINATNNTSLVTASVYVQKISTYSAESSSNPHDLKIDNTLFSDNNVIDMNPETTPRLCVSGSKTITHSSDGSKSITIKSGTAAGSGTLPTGAGFGPTSGTASATVALTVIPREAYITNASVNFELENDIALTLSNPGNFYLKIEFYVGATLIATRNAGQVTSYNYVPDAGEEADAYAEIPNALSSAITFRVKTYSDSGYTTQVGVNKDKTGTMTINSTTNAPTFTDCAVANVDKNIVVTDPYGNTLVTSSTSTLLGADTRVIKTHSKVRATVSVGNQAVSKNSATITKYRFSTPTQYIDITYTGGEVTGDLDNILVKDYTITAIDSRGLSTVVNKSLTNLSEPTAISIWDVVLARDSSIEDGTKLQLSGLLWKFYFGGASNGVLNTVTAHYRFKSTALASWTTLDGTFTITIASPGLVTKSAHGLSTGDILYLTTTGALPTGLSASTQYFVIKNDANTFWLATSYANALAGTKINTSGTQSGTHTLHAQSLWTAITLTDDGSGNLSYDSYINGDMGASGFDPDKSYDIQVRVFDKVSYEIDLAILSVGTPLIHKTKAGVAFGAKYDTGVGGKIQTPSLALAGTLITASGAEINKLDGLTADTSELNKLDGFAGTASDLNSTITGWAYMPGTFGYTSAWVMSTNVDYTGLITVGTRVRIYANGAYSYLYVKSLTSSAITFIPTSDYSVYNGAITYVWYSLGNPADWPADHSYTTTLGGWTTETATFKYRVDGRLMTVYASFSGTSDSTGATFTAPMTPVYSNRGFFNGRDNNTLAHRMFEVSSSNGVVTLWTNVTGSGWTASGTKSIVNFLMPMFI